PKERKGREKGPARGEKATEGVRTGAVPAVAKPAGTGPSLPCQGGTSRLCRCTGVHVMVRSPQRSGGNLVGVHKLVGYTGLWLPTGPGSDASLTGPEHRYGTTGSPGPTEADGTAIPSGIRSRPLSSRTQVRTTASQLSVTLRA